MDDLISRQAVLEMAYDMSEIDGEHFTEPCMVVDVEDIQKLLPVKPQEKTGHWRHYEGMLICSECGTEFYDDIMEYCGDDVPKCCPDCGCRMVDPQERSDKE